MSPQFGVFIMMSNYFHDVATAMLPATAIAMRMLIKRYPKEPTPALREYFLRVMRSIKTVAKFSLGWILVGGIPRTLYFRSFEWATAAEHGQSVALIVKHLLIIHLVMIGTVLWKKNTAMLRDIMPEAK